MAAELIHTYSDMGMIAAKDPSFHVADKQGSLSSEERLVQACFGRL
jgi:hypothetical protein